MNDWEITLDRLADGELSREEYSALLASLDQREEGWKKCALALLESQALKAELRGLVDEPPPVAAVERRSPEDRVRAWSHKTFWAQALAVAACVGLAFWVGRNSIAPARDQVAVVDPPSSPTESPEPAQPHQGRITLVLNGADGQPREMELPVVDGSYVDPQSFLARSAVIPPDVVEAIERSGHKIERRREFMRQPIDANHEVVVPIDRLRVVPVSLPMY